MEEKTLENILSKEEGQTFECKRALKKPSEVLATICAFPNTDGGVFIYGLSDPEKVKGKERLTGISEGKDNSDELLKLIANNFVPPLPKIEHFYADIENTDEAGDRILVIYIAPSNNIHSLTSGQTYIRRGKQNNLLTHQQAMQLQYEKGALSFESELVPNATIDDLEPSLLEEFMAFNKSDEKDKFQFLKNLGLAEKKNDKVFLNNAAILLFGKNPFAALKRKCGITISHYIGVKKMPSAKPNFRRHPLKIEGHLLKQIEGAFKYVSENALPIKLEGATFKRLRIPDFVTQEAITNAVIHRDYSIQNDIQIRIFDDKIEVESPGWFAGLVTPETILDDRFARNPIIENTLRKMPNPPNLDIGEGVDRMFREMRRKNLYLPLYLPRKYTPHAVQVILFNEVRINYWDIVDKYLGEHESINNKEFREITGLDTSLASELLKKWTKQQMLEKFGGSKKKTFYKKPSSKKVGTQDLLEGLF